MSGQRIVRFFSEMLKADLWEVLAIIGALQILLLPLIAKATWIRVVAFLGLASFIPSCRGPLTTTLFMGVPTGWTDTLELQRNGHGTADFLV